MPNIKWFEAVEIVEPHVVKIWTPSGSGSGFLISNGKNSLLCGIATAGHVVDHAHFWEEPILITHLSSGKSIKLRYNERAIFLDQKRDTAAIVFDRGEFSLPSDPLTLAPEDKMLKVGNQIAWLGFPAIPSANLCYFSGSISAWAQDLDAYLVDGVAINGVSGGPAFHLTGVNESPVFLIGVVSAYIPNRATGEALPGLSIVRNVKQFHELAPTFASLDQAREAEPPIEPSPSPSEASGEGEQDK